MYVENDTFTVKHNNLTKESKILEDYFEPSFDESKHEADTSIPKKYLQSFEEIVKDAGFDLEEHYVTTEDGYILKMHRLISPQSKQGPPVFM